MTVFIECTNTAVKKSEEIYLKEVSVSLDILKIKLDLTDSIINPKALESI